jgi:hypothetical protein
VLLCDLAFARSDALPLGYKVLGGDGHEVSRVVRLVGMLE